MVDSHERTSEQVQNAEAVELERLLRASTQRLHKLRLQAALFGIQAPAALLVDIEEQEQEISRLRKRKLLATPVEDRGAEDHFEEMQRLDKLLDVHRSSLHHLEVQAARRGPVDVPPHVLNQIEVERLEISRLRARLGELATRVVKHEAAESDGADDVQHLEQLLMIHHRNLALLREQAALHGAATSLAVHHSIEFEEQAIARLEAQLRNLAPTVSRRKGRVMKGLSREQWLFVLWGILGLAGLALMIIGKPLWLKLAGVLPVIGVGFDFLRWSLERSLRGIVLSQVTAMRLVRDTQCALSELKGAIQGGVFVPSDVEPEVAEAAEEVPIGKPLADRRAETFAVAKLEMPQSGELPIVGEEFALLAGILQRIPTGFVGEPIDLPDVATIELDVTVYAQDMTISPHWSQKLRYYAGRDSGLVEFRLCPNAVGRKEIRVEFHYRFHWLGQIKFEVEVAEQEEPGSLTEAAL